MTVIGAHPARLDLVVHAGDPVAANVPVLEADNDPQALDGWTVRVQALDPTNDQVLHTFTTSTTGGSSVQITATPTETGAWQWTTYAARLVATVTPPAGAPSPITLGWVRFYRH